MTHTHGLFLPGRGSTSRAFTITRFRHIPLRYRPARLVILVSILLVSLPAIASASIVPDAQSNATATGQSNITWSHTVGGSADRFLAVGISYAGGLPSSSTVTYAGIPLTLITYVASLNQTSVQLWGLTNPPAGTANVAVSLPSAEDFAAGAVSFFGVDQTVPYGLWYANNGASSPATLGVPTAAGELMLAIVAIENGPVATPSTGQTEHWNTGPATARGAGGALPGAGGTLNMDWTYSGNNRWAMVGIPLKPVAAQTPGILGRVFEDVNYGGGAGRNWTTVSGSGGSPRSAARVELFDNTGAFVSFTTTDASGNYSFSGLAAGNYLIRVVANTVTSSRTGYVAGLLPVLTFRTDASTGTALDVIDYVGGHDPAMADAGGAAAGWVLNPSTGVFSGNGEGKAHAFAPVTVAAAGVTGVDFGFNFDAIVNINNAGRGSLRQAITNANTLGGDASLAQAGLVAGKENAVFMISNGTAAAGLRATNNYFSGGVATIAVSAGGLPWIDSPLVLDATIQPGYAGAPVVQLDGAATTGSDNGIQLRASNSVVRGLIVHSFADEGIEIVGSSGFGDNNVVQHNWVGLNAAGAVAPNRENGVILAFAAAGNLIGGTGPNQGNVISGNTFSGLIFRDSGTDGNIAQGNRIGVGTDGMSSRPNGRNGVEVSTAVLGTVVGGVGAGTGNTIAYNRSAGVRVNFDGGTGNAVLGNTLFANDSLGIDLVNGGVTANDGAKTVGQPNVRMDHPVFTSASLVGTSLTLAGYVGSAPNQAAFAAARVEVFRSDVDASGYGEGQSYLGFLTSDANGNFTGTLTVTGLAVGDRVTGTATDAANNTSEFGANFVVTAGTAAIAGRVFEDVNYGGGAGRNWTAVSGSGGSPRSAARVELFDNTGAFVSFATTDVSGNYSFSALVAGNYLIRVVANTVTSSRTGYVAGLLPVLTFRADASTGTVSDVTNYVGGHDPATADAGNAGAGWVLAPATGVFSGSGSGKAHAFAPVTVAAAGLAGIDFGFNFDAIVNTNDAGQGSLRQAITNANALANAGLAQSGRTAGIEHGLFMIANGTSAAGLRSSLNYFAGGAATIAVLSALPMINDPMVLDAALQPGWSGMPIIELNGAGAGISSGLVLFADGGTIRGLVINRFGGDGIVVNGDGTIVAGNVIGLGVSGTIDMGNANAGISVSAGASATVIGGTGTTDRNVISGNNAQGILMSGANALVQGNYIGTDITGSTGLGNALGGIVIQSAGGGNTIGGAIAGARNVISGNGAHGVFLFASSYNLILGNYIGVNASGASLLGNAGDGINVSGGANNALGGTAPSEGNLVAGNQGSGIEVTD